MKKIIILICLIIIITGCNKKAVDEDNKISKITEKAMIEKNNISNENTDEDSIEKNVGEIIEENIINAVGEDKNKTTDSITTNIIINKTEVVDDTFDYQIHKGRIDCLDVDECINISLPIQFELKNIIDNVFYLEVKAESNKTLGYYINYSFKNHQYENYDICLNKEKYLKEKLSDRISKGECSSDGLLVVESDYQGDNDD